MNENIADRISFLVSAGGDGKNTVFANKIGDNEANIRNYRSGKTTPKYSTLVNIVNYCGVNTQWIMTGKGVPFKRSSPFYDSNPNVIINGSCSGLIPEDPQLFSEFDEFAEEWKLKKERHETLRTSMPDAFMRICFLEETIDRKEAQIADLNREIGRLRHILTTHNIDPNAQD